MRLETLEQKRDRIAKKLARESANRRLLNRIERFEYVEKVFHNPLHPWAIGLDSVGF